MRKLMMIGLLAGAATGLSGCYVAPAPGYYRPPPVAAGVYVAPRPYGYYRPPGYGYGYGRYGYRPYY